MSIFSFQVWVLATQQWKRSPTDDIPIALYTYTQPGQYLKSILSLSRIASIALPISSIVANCFNCVVNSQQRDVKSLEGCDVRGHAEYTCGQRSMLGQCLTSEVTLNMHEVRILNMHEVGTWLTQFATWLKQLATRLMHFGDASIEAEAIKGLFSYNFHHLDKYTPDMANIHTCPTSISKTMESIKHGTNRIGPMQVSEPVRTKNMEKT